MSETRLKAYESIDAVNESQWNNVVEQSGRGSVFHRTGWLRAVEQGLDLPACHLVLESGGHPVGVLPNVVVDVDLPDAVPAPLDRVAPKRLVSLAPGFGGPLLVGDEREHFELLFDNVDRVVPGDVAYHRIETVGNDFMRYGERFGRHGYEPVTDSCRFAIDLERGWEAVEADMDRSKRKNLADARDGPATVERRDLGRDVLRSFYDTYRRTMDRVGGTAYPFAFFELLREELPDRIELFTVTVDGEFAGGELNLVDEERSTVRGFFHGLDSDFFEYHPSELVDVRSIRWAIEQGYGTYDLGSTVPDLDDGAFRYKAELGADLDPVVAWERGTSRVQWPAYRFGRRLARRGFEPAAALPLPDRVGDALASPGDAVDAFPSPTSWTR